MTAMTFSMILTQAKASATRMVCSCSSIQDSSADPRTRDVAAALLHVRLARSWGEDKRDVIHESRTTYLERAAPQVLVVRLALEDAGDEIPGVSPL